MEPTISPGIQMDNTYQAISLLLKKRVTLDEVNGQWRFSWTDVIPGLDPAETYPSFEAAVQRLAEVLGQQREWRKAA
jgi:hypothetical protein